MRFFRGLSDGTIAKGPEKARKKPLKYWFDAFFGTRKVVVGTFAEGEILVVGQYLRPMRAFVTAKVALDRRR